MELINNVLISLGYDVNDEDIRQKLGILIEAVKEHLIEGGAPETIGNKKTEITCISIGVNDLLNCTSGEVKFSPAFYIFANQICRR